MTESTIFYKSLFDALANFPPENYKTAMQAVADYAFTGKEPEGLPLLENTVFTLVRPQIDANKERYEKSLNGGRPQVELPSQEELEAMRQELGSWDAVAAELGVNKATLFRRRQSQNESQKSQNESQKSQNESQIAKPNDNVNDNVSESVSVSVSVDETETVTEKREGEHSSPVAAEPPAFLGSDTLSENSVLFPQEAIACTSQPQKSARFIPPTIGEVAAYCKERGNGVDAESFVAFYASKGWFVGKNKMKDWRQAVITWEKRDKERAQGQYSARASPAPAAVQREESGGWHTPHTVFPVIRTEEDYKAHEKRMEEYNRWADECLGLTKRDET